MASYHLKIKTDKIKNHKKISPTEHIKYIAREGKYKNLEQKELQQLNDNYLKSKDLIMELPETEILVYESSFGNIFCSQKGIRITNDASLQTLGLAFELANHLFVDNIELHGNQKFLAKAILAAAYTQTRFNFADPFLNSLYHKEVENNGTIGQQSNRYTQIGNYNSFSQQHSESTGTLLTEASLTSDRNGLSILFGSELDADQLQIDMHMSGDVQQDSIQTRGKEYYPELRYRESISPEEFGRRLKPHVFDEEIKQRLVKQAQQIIYYINNDLYESQAVEHLKYINREEAFAKRGGCIYKGHHLPSWSKDDPHIFFENSKKYERANACQYKEIELSLPNELTLDQNLEILNEFLEKHFQNHYYSYAVHEKIGFLSGGILHPHVHIMFSEREIDDIERIHERTPQQFFSRYNPKHPEKGGCKKPDKWNGKKRSSHLSEVRKDFADIQNKILKKYGYTARVDHRRLDVQRADALLKGDYDLAEELNRPAETTIPLGEALNLNNPKVKSLQELRSARKKIKRNKNVIKYLKNQQNAENVVNMIDDAIANITSETPEFEDEKIVKLTDELQNYRNLISQNPDAIIEKMMAFAPPKTKEAWGKLKKYSDIRKKNLEIINDLNFLRLHESALQENQQLTKSIMTLSQKIKPFFENIDNIDSIEEINKSNSQLLQHSDSILSLIKETKEHISLKSSNTKILSFDDLKFFLQEEIQKIDKEMQKNKEYQKALITEERAYAIAQNRYTKGMIKKINTQIHDQKKLMSSINAIKKKKDLSVSASDKMKLNNAIEKMEATYYKNNVEIEAAKDQVHRLCSTAPAQKQIAKIMLGIIRANKVQLAKISKNGTQLQQLDMQKKTYLKQYKQLNQMNHFSSGSKFMLTDFNHPHLASYKPSIRQKKSIIDAICGDVVAAALVMHIDEEKKDWQFLSVFEKDRLINQLH